MSKSIPVLLCLAAVVTHGLWAADSFGKLTEDDDIVVVKVVGTLKTGQVAIGGETTGTTIKSKGITWQLEFADNAELKQTAEKLSGKRVTVEGSLERRSGVEVKELWVITVTKLQALRE